MIISRAIVSRDTYQLANEAEHTIEQQPNSGNDLEQGLRQETPERVEFLLGMGHALNLALCVVDGFSHSTRELSSVVSFINVMYNE